MDESGLEIEDDGGLRIEVFLDAAEDHTGGVVGLRSWSIRIRKTSHGLVCVNTRCIAATTTPANTLVGDIE